MRLVLLLGLLCLKGIVEASCPASVTAEANGYTERSGKWYKKNAAMTQPAAVAECKVYGARLAMFKTAADYAELDTMVTGDSWVGVLNRKMEVMCWDGNAMGDCTDDQFHWIDGTPLQHSAAHMPNFDANDNLPCVRMMGNGHLGDKDCNLVLPSICQLDCADVVSTTPECANIPAGYEKLYDGAYYKATTVQTNLLNGMTQCHADGARLAKIDSEEALHSVKYIVRNHAQSTTGLRTAYVNPTGTNCDNFPGASHTACNNLYVDADDETPFISQSWMGSTQNSWGVETQSNEHCSKMKFDNSAGKPTRVVNVDCRDNILHVCQFRCDVDVSLPSSCTNEPYFKILGRNLLYQGADTFDNAVSTCIAKGGRMADFKDPSQLGQARILADILHQTNGFWIGLKNTDNIFTCLDAASCSAPEIEWINDNSQFDSSFSTHLTAIRFNTAAFQYGYMMPEVATSPLPIQGASAVETKEFFCEIDCVIVTCSAPTPPVTGQTYDWDTTKTSAVEGESTT